MAKVTRFKDLRCWQASRRLVKDVYTVCKTGELSKDIDTKSQLKKAALSTMNNIAEGFARFHRKEFDRFLDYSQSSAAEVKSMLYVLEDMQYLSSEEIMLLHQKVDEAKNQTLALIRYINRNNITSENANNMVLEQESTYITPIHLPNEFLINDNNNTRTH